MHNRPVSASLDILRMLRINVRLVIHPALLARIVVPAPAPLVPIKVEDKLLYLSYEDSVLHYGMCLNSCPDNYYLDLY